MKRVGNLWPELVSFSNLVQAAKAAAAGKKARPNVAAFLLDLEPNLLRLQRELCEDRYRPGPYRTFQVLDPKPRQISAAPFRDRVVHHALTRVLEPVFEPRFSPFSFACRTGFGTHRALDLARNGVRRFPYVLKCDVRKYFASIDHEILNSQLSRVIKCKPTLNLARRIIDGSNAQEAQRALSGAARNWKEHTSRWRRGRDPFCACSPKEMVRYYPGDDLFSPFERRRGLPLGNQTSQFFANVYLNRLDHRLAHEIGSGAYARYVDDLLIFADSKRRLGEIREILELELEGLRLEVHPGKSRIYRCAEGVTFLGWRFFPNRVRLVRGNVVRFRRRMERLSSEFDAGALELSAVKQRVAAWIAHAAYGDTWRLRERLLGDFVLRPPARMPRRG